MSLNEMEIKNGILKQLNELSKKTFNSIPLPSPMVYVNVDKNYGSFNISYVYPNDTYFNENVLKHIRKYYPRADRMMTFCQGMFDLNGKLLSSQCSLTTEDGSFLQTNKINVLSKMPKDVQSKINNFQSDINFTISSNIQPNHKDLHPEIFKLLRRLTK